MTIINIVSVLFLTALATWWSINYLYKKELKFSAIISEETLTDNGEKDESLKWKRMVLIWITVLVGMFTTSIYKKLKNDIPIEFSELSIHLLISAIVSPIIVRTTIGSQSEIESAPLYRVALLGYQNGFFWEIILGEI